MASDTYRSLSFLLLPFYTVHDSGQINLLSSVTVVAFKPSFHSNWLTIKTGTIQGNALMENICNPFSSCVSETRLRHTLPRYKGKWKTIKLSAIYDNWEQTLIISMWPIKPNVIRYRCPVMCFDFDFPHRRRFHSLARLSLYQFL